MAINPYLIAEATIIGESLKRLLEVGTVSQRKALKDVICESLREAYENTIWTDFVIDIDIPGGPGKSPSQKGIEDPRRPGDEIEEEYENVHVVARPKINERKMELLNQALSWGCEWAQDELMRLRGTLSIGR